MLMLLQCHVRPVNRLLADAVPHLLSVDNPEQAFLVPVLWSPDALLQADADGLQGNAFWNQLGPHRVSSYHT